MIHAHVIITAAILLVGAFVALIICMCVDIVPIIKSRGSTLASRDSATQEQARKLKKSLRQNKHQLTGSSNAYGRSEKLSTRHESASKNLYESGNHLSSSRNAELHATATVTKFQNSTPTTATMVVSTATHGGANETSHCFSTPEGDHSTQQTSSAASSLSQGSKSNSVVVDVESQSVRTPSPSKQQKCSSSHVTVSVHNATKAVGAKVRSCESSPVRSRAVLGRRSTDERLDHSSAHNSPSFNSSRQSLVGGKLTSNRSSDGSSSGARSDYEKHRKTRGQYCRTHTPIEGGNIYPEARRPNSANSDFGDDSSEQENYSSRHRDYHDAPWDSSHREPLVYREQSPCKWCYVDHSQCTKHHHRPRTSCLTPVHSSHSNSPNHSEDNVPCSCAYHRPKSDNHANSPLLKQKYAGQHSARYDRQTSSPSRSLTSGSLHGSGAYHRSSPCHSSSSSVSPSSLSSSSHSSKRKRRTKLEDIQEDAGWSDDEDTHVAKREDTGLLDKDSNSASLRNTPSTLHLSVVEGASSDNEQSYPIDAAYQTNLSQYLGMKRGSRDLAIVNDTKTAIEGIVTYSGT